MKSLIAITLLGVSGMATATETQSSIERIGEPTLNGQRLPFSTAVRAGDTVYLSGALGIDANGKLADGMDAQARLAMDNLGAGLKAAGLGWADVVKCTVMLDDMKDWPAFNKVYVTYFPDGKYPARSAFGTDGLALGALVEVECIAYAGKR
jgi:2-iminobutanoate/2-iminopropanoate deaminase